MWSEHYFPSTDGVELHADVLLPAGLKAGDKVPVILMVGPYFAHAGMAQPEGHKSAGPSGRFVGLIDEGRIFERGYAMVMVDLRGFGGSTGCHDLFGPGEQADVRAAVDWAATQSWSSGSVGMFGSSYDGTTPLIGNNLNHPALKAVVAQAPIWQPYQYFRSGEVPRLAIKSLADVFTDIATIKPMKDDTKKYKANATWEKSNPDCLEQIQQTYRTPDLDSGFWQARDLTAQATGTQTPMLIAMGFLDLNAEPRAVQQFLANHEGSERAWFGPWDHGGGARVTEDGKRATGRTGWVQEEVMPFFDQYLKGTDPTTTSPAFQIQDSNGTWRSQDNWPVADQTVHLPIGGGTYTDKGEAITSGTVFTRHAQPQAKAVRITGTPRITLTAAGKGNVMTKLYDVAPNGEAVMFNLQVSQISSGETMLEFKSNDWTLNPGHVLAVTIGSIDDRIEWYGKPSNQKITIEDAVLALDLDDPADDVVAKGKKAPELSLYRENHTATLDLDEAEATFEIALD
nr:CocE/NonD family hydrolase [Kineosporia babensis]